MLEVEYGIPIPPISRPGRPRMYPFGAMKVGGSFLIRTKRASGNGGLATRAAKQTGYQFTTRKVQGGLRVWRVK